MIGHIHWNVYSRRPPVRAGLGRRTEWGRTVPSPIVISRTNCVSSVRDVLQESERTRKPPFRESNRGQERNRDVKPTFHGRSFPRVSLTEMESEGPLREGGGSRTLRTRTVPGPSDLDPSSRRGLRKGPPCRPNSLFDLKGVSPSRRLPVSRAPGGVYGGEDPGKTPSPGGGEGRVRTLPVAEEGAWDQRQTGRSSVRTPKRS